jgi:hypothetical protein
MELVIRKSMKGPGALAFPLAAMVLLIPMMVE